MTSVANNVNLPSYLVSAQDVISNYFFYCPFTRPFTQISFGIQRKYRDQHVFFFTCSLIDSN